MAIANSTYTGLPKLRVLSYGIIHQSRQNNISHCSFARMQIQQSDCLHKYGAAVLQPFCSISLTINMRHLRFGKWEEILCECVAEYKKTKQKKSYYFSYQLHYLIFGQEPSNSLKAPIFLHRTYDICHK